MSFMRHSITITSGSAESEIEVEVKYSVTPGYRGDYYQPPESPSAEIIRASIVHKDKSQTLAPWLIDMLAEDEQLLAACLADNEQRAEDAAEYRAEAAREERMLSRQN